MLLCEAKNNLRLLAVANGIGDVKGLSLNKLAAVRNIRNQDCAIFAVRDAEAQVTQCILRWCTCF